MCIRVFVSVRIVPLANGVHVTVVLYRKIVPSISLSH